MIIEPLVSIAMCTYNGEKFVEEQVLSICNQTYKNIEIVIADDASTDKTYEILKKLSTNDDRIKLFRNPTNLGLNVNFEKACKLTTGDFIAISDQDDIWEPNKIERLMDIMLNSPDVILSHCISARISQNKQKHIKSTKQINFSAGKSVQNFFLYNFINGHNMLFRRVLLTHATPFPENIFYDWWLAANASCYGKIKAEKNILVWHRVHQTNASGAALKKRYLHEELIKVLSAFIQIKAMKDTDKNLAEQLLFNFKNQIPGKISWSLFLLILKNAYKLFASKKRLFPYVSYIKHSRRFANGSSIFK